MDNAAAQKALSKLVGIWEGSGEGEFPTLAPFAYRERLEITEAGPMSFHYRQHTRRRVDEADVDSHVETGFISVGDDGEVVVLNAQGHDRVEVLRGTVSQDGDGIAVDLRSVTLAHDGRMVSSWRSIHLSDDSLRYTMGMATTAVPDGARHLAAQLSRLE